MFLIEDSRVSLTIGFYHFNKPFTTIVEETVHGEKRSLPCTSLMPYHLPFYRSGVP